MLLALGVFGDISAVLGLGVLVSPMRLSLTAPGNGLPDRVVIQLGRGLVI